MVLFIMTCACYWLDYYYYLHRMWILSIFFFYWKSISIHWLVCVIYSLALCNHSFSNREKKISNFDNDEFNWARNKNQLRLTHKIVLVWISTILAANKWNWKTPKWRQKIVNFEYIYFKIAFQRLEKREGKKNALTNSNLSNWHAVKSGFICM